MDAFKTNKAITFSMIALIFLMPSSVLADKKDEEIRIAMFGNMRSSEPGVKRDAFTDDVMIQIVEPLVTHRADLSIAPMTAEAYSVSKDLTEYSFTLRAGLTYHNGAPVSAQHAVAVWEKMLAPETGFQCLNFYNGQVGAKVLSVTAPDDRTLTIKLDRPSSVFLEKLAYVQCPIPLLHPDSWDEDGNWIKPISTGPYKLGEWRKGQYVILERHDSYIPRQDAASGLAGRKVPYAKRLNFITISDQMAAKAALNSGQVDILMSLAPITALEMRTSNRANVLDSPGLSRRTILMQTDDPLLSDKRIRQAIAHAIDLKTFAEVATLDLTTPNPSTMPAGDFNYTTTHGRIYDYDLEKSKRLLKEAGYNGEVITLHTTRVEQAFFDIAMIAEAMLKKAGINIEVKVVEMASLLGAYFDGNYQLMAFEYSPRMTAFMNYSSMIGDKKRNPSRWQDAKAQALLNQIATTADPLKRKKLFEDIHRRMMAEAPLVNIYNAPVIDVISKRIEGYKPWIGSKLRMWNVRLKEN